MLKILLAIALLFNLPTFAQEQGLRVTPSIVGTSAVGQLPGTATNDNASAGNVGEYVESVVLVGSAVSLTSGTTANVTSISLTAGDWDVSGLTSYTMNAATVTNFLTTAINTVSATGPTRPNGGINSMYTTGIAGATVFDLNTGVVRYSLSATTTIYLVATAGFTTNTAAAYGKLSARRVR